MAARAVKEKDRKRRYAKRKPTTPEAQEIRNKNLVQIKKGFSLNPAGTRIGRPLRGQSLAEHVRTVGNEVIDVESGWTRLDAMIRRLYSDAISGKVPSAELILNRGWGKVPTPIELDISGEVRKLLTTSGMSVEELRADPILAALIDTSGVILDAISIEGTDQYRVSSDSDVGQDPV